MEEKKLFPIGEVAKLYHISVGNLRHYEKIGLLQPEYVNPQSGYRYYSTAQFECLNTIRYLRALGMSLEAIKSFLTDRDTDNLKGLLLEQRAAVEQKQQELERIARKISSRIEKLQDALDGRVDEILLRDIPKRRLAILKTSITPRNYLSLEGSIRQLDGASDCVFLGKVGLGLSRESLLAGRFRPYELVFLELDEADEYTGELTEIPPERCVTVRFRGGHENAEGYYERLLAYIGEHGLTVGGFSKEITLIDYGFTNDESQFVTELQIPVEKREE